MYESDGLVELHVETLYLTGFNYTGNLKANYLKVIELSIKENWSYLAKKVEFCWFSVMNHVTIFDPSCRK